MLCHTDLHMAQCNVVLSCIYVQGCLTETQSQGCGESMQCSGAFECTSCIGVRYKTGVHCSEMQWWSGVVEGGGEAGMRRHLTIVRYASARSGQLNEY